MLMYIGIALGVVITVFIILVIINIMNKCSKKKMRELKLRVQLAVRTLKANIHKVQDDLININPFMLLSMYPFYKDVLQLPFYVDRDSCFTREAVHEIVKDTYGTNLEYASSLHTRLNEDPYHYLIIDINNAFDYYDRYKTGGLAALLL